MSLLGLSTSISTSTSLLGLQAQAFNNNASLLSPVESPIVPDIQASAPLDWKARFVTPAAFSLSMLGSLSGCFEDTALGPIATDSGTDSSTDAGTTDATTDTTTTMPTDTGTTGDGTSDTGTPVDDIPVVLHPTNGALLPDARAFLAWAAGDIPDGKMITGYRYCFTSQGAPVIDEESECPNETLVANAFGVIDPLPTNGEIHWKVATEYGDDTSSMYTSLQILTTDDAIIGHYRMDEGVGSMLEDSSGLGNNGTMNNMDIVTSWVPGINDMALSFDALDDFVDLGDTYNFDRTDAMTFMSWTRRSEVGAAHMMMGRMDFSDAAVSRGYWLGFEQDDKLHFMLRHDNGSNDRIQVISQDTFATPDVNRHITYTYDGSGLASGVNIYVDAINLPTEVVVDTLSGTTLNNAPARLGAAVANNGDNSSFKNVFAGVQDDVMIFRRALTDEEIINNICAREAINREEINDPSPLPAECQ